ncbi:MAG: tail fiber protein [Bacteroidales bacterium]|jgi:hypothetical protein|nr:tail fiber protein [Bacteroidales bacterium]
MIRYLLLLLCFITLTSICLIAQVGINTTDPNAKSILELSSDNKGLLVPRLTKVQMSTMTLNTTDEGMLVYCTDLDLFCYFNGADWISMPAWGQKVDLSDPTTEQNISPLNMNSNSGVGVGTADPQSKLTIVGNLAVGKDSIAPTNGAYIFGKVRMGVNAGIVNQLEVGGNVNIRGKLKEYGNDLLPAGTIVMWYGSTADIPAGWGLCNGSTYSKLDGSGNIVSPDLSGRFVMGAGTRGEITIDHLGNTTIGISNNHTPNQVGGSDKVLMDISQMPSHNHGGSVTGGNHVHTMAFDDGDGGGAGPTGITVNTATCGDPDGTCGGNANQPTNDSGAHSHTLSIYNTPSLAAVAHSNNPPYYVLAYIIKL